MKFETDTLDESDTLFEVLAIRKEEIGGSLEISTLRGTHATPLAPVRRKLILNLPSSGLTNS